VVSTAYYLRAHKKEPFLYFWVSIAITSVLSMLWLAKHTGTGGVVIGYFICSGVLRVIAAVYVFVTKRREWHAPGVLEMSLPLEVG
jgi:O-antigen/teichoic acid export membrane protein